MTGILLDWMTMLQFPIPMGVAQNPA